MASFLFALKQLAWCTMFRKMTFVNIVGFIMCMFGAFLPWGERNLIPIRTDSCFMFGIQLLLGQVMFMGACVTGLFHILYRVKNQKHLLIFAVISEVVVTISPLIWIVYPGALAPYKPYYSYKALYGAYLSFVSGTLLLSGTLITSL